MISRKCAQLRGVFQSELGEPCYTRDLASERQTHLYTHDTPIPGDCVERLPFGKVASCPCSIAVFPVKKNTYPTTRLSLSLSLLIPFHSLCLSFFSPCYSQFSSPHISLGIVLASVTNYLSLFLSATWAPFVRLADYTYSTQPDEARMSTQEGGENYFWSELDSHLARAFHPNRISWARRVVQRETLWLVAHRIELFFFLYCHPWRIVTLEMDDWNSVNNELWYLWRSRF